MIVTIFKLFFFDQQLSTLLGSGVMRFLCLAFYENWDLKFYSDHVLIHSEVA